MKIADWLSSVFVVLVLYLLPFLLVVVLPSVVVPKIIKKVFKVKEKLPSFLPFTITLIIGAILGNLFWQYGLYNHIYYEWDSLFLPYTFLWGETPSFFSANWIAKGWTVFDLEVIWCIVTLCIYLTSLFIALHINRKKNGFTLYRKILIGSLCIMLAVPGLFAGLGYVINEAQIVDTPCEAKSVPAKILYSDSSGQNTLWSSDLQGKNVQKIGGNQGVPDSDINRVFSPDGSMMVSSVSDWNSNELWIKCVNGKGNYPIKLPMVHLENTGFTNPLRRTSWSPDSKKLIMNYGGDLLLVNAASKQITVLKRGVAIRKTNVPTLPYEFGDALWASDNTIYYTEFNGDAVNLRALDFENSLIKTFSGPVSLNSMNADNTIMYIDQYHWETDKNSSSLSSVFLNLKIKEIMNPWIGEQNEGDNLLWSHNPNIYTYDTSGDVYDVPSLQTSTAFKVDIQTRTSQRINDAVIAALEQKGISTRDRVVAIWVHGFINDDLLLQINLTRTTNVSRQINALFTSDGRLQILQDYSEGSYEKNFSNQLIPKGFIGIP